MAKVITLPKKLIEEGEIVLIPRSEYERFLDFSKKQEELEKGLDQSLKEVQEKEVVGPFDGAQTLMKSLSSQSSK